MPKKNTASAFQLVRIPVSGAGTDALTKAQKEFNRLTTRIAKMEREVAAFREAATRLRQRVQTEHRPLQAQHNDQRAALVRLLDQAFENQKLTKGEKNKITDLIGQCADLLERGHADLGPIIDKYAPPLSEQEETEADKGISEMMKQLFSLQYGIEFDPAVDVSSQEKFQAYVVQKMAEQQAEFAEGEAQQAARRATRKKSPKQQAAEEKKQAEEKNITKAVRSLYMDLVKALHPDLEPDEAEKTRKTGLLQRVTAAYEANELLTLLCLQLELQRIDQTHLENLAEDQLRHYNKLLREQVRELDEALYQEQVALSDFTGKPYYFTLTPVAIDLEYQHQKIQLTAKIKQLTAEVLAFEHDPAALKAFLKQYKIPKAGPGPMFVRR